MLPRKRIAKWHDLVPYEYSLDTIKSGEGGIRTHEGVTPTRFRVVRDQPDSATSPNAIRRSNTLKADEPMPAPYSKSHRSFGLED